jgi:hypothetical protein
VDLTALRFVPQRFFGVFMSVNPVLAALAGLVILGQHLVTHEWAGIIIVVAASMITTLKQSRGQVDVSEDSSSVEAGGGAAYRRVGHRDQDLPRRSDRWTAPGGIDSACRPGAAMQA